MKFSAALIALGAQAVKLQDFDEFAWGRLDLLHGVLDMDGSGFVDTKELQDLAEIGEYFGFLDEEQVAEMTDFALEFEDVFDGPFTVEQLDEYCEFVLEEGTEEDLEQLDRFADYMEGAEDMVLKLVWSIYFKQIDADGSGTITVSDIDYVVSQYGWSESAYDIFENDTDENGEIDLDEYFASFESQFEGDPEYRFAFVAGAVSFLGL